MQACAYNPAHRYGTAAELLAALESISGKVGQKAVFRQEPEQEIDQPGKKPLTQTKVRKNVLCVPEANSEIWGQKNIKRSQVTEVIFSGTLPNHPVVNAWDVSAAQDRSILAWMEGSVLHVASLLTYFTISKI